MVETGNIITQSPFWHFLYRSHPKNGTIPWHSKQRFSSGKNASNDWGEERMAFGAFARFDKNRNHYLQGIEIESWPFQGVEGG